jgi:uncharacterized protein YcbK (DUF882 family)
VVLLVGKRLEGFEMKLTEHFTLAELSHSDTAIARHIDNTPPSYIMPKLLTLALGLEQVRSLLGDKPIQISSGYRSMLLNAAIGSKSTSQHLSGCAADFTCPDFGTPAEIVVAIVKSDIGYDQLISEDFMHSQWVHISFSSRNRRQALIIDSSGTRAFA